jgi:large-conductance mechanosensitive channel
MLKGFKDFIMRGNVVDLAVGIVIGAAFGTLVAALVADLITPVIGVIGGEPDFSALSFTINGSTFRYGHFINALIAFLLIAAAVEAFWSSARWVEPQVKYGVGAACWALVIAYLGWQGRPRRTADVEASNAG